MVLPVSSNDSMEGYRAVKAALISCTHEQRVRFTLVCARRALTEVRSLSTSDLDAITVFSDVLGQVEMLTVTAGNTHLDALWRVIEPYMQEDEDDDRYTSLTFSVAFVLSLVFGAIKEPESDVDHATSAVSEIFTLVTFLYADIDRVADAELAWQLHACRVIAATESTPAEVFASVPDYDRGPLDPDAL
jgi:hypothetical protein